MPVSGRLGAENDGWSVAKYLLTHERGSKTATAMIMKVESLRSFLDSEAETGFDLRNDASYMQQIAGLEIELEAYAAFEEKLFSSIAAGESVGTVSSMLKIRRTELRQELDVLLLDAVTYYGLPYQPDFREFGNNDKPVGSDIAGTAMPRYLNNRAASIYAGSNEIQRNILSKQILGL